MLPWSAQALDITPYTAGGDGAALGSAVLAANSGITILSTTFIGASGQSGIYTGLNLPSSQGGPTISAPDGVLLTNGTATLPQTNTSTHFGATTDTGPNAMLSALSASTGGTTVTYDQNVLSVQFTVNNPAATGVISKVVYGTEEYPETSVTDIFGVFVDGKNYAYFADGSLISFKKGQTNSDFNDNTNSSYPLEYDGISNLLTVNAILDPNLAVHTITFAIADTYDSIFDSGAFISSLTSGSVTSGGITTAPTINTTDGDIAPNVFSLGSSAAQADMVDFNGGVLRLIGGSFPNNIITAPVTIDATNGTVDTSTGSGGFSGVVSGPGSLTIEGGQTFSLTGNNTYQGGTIVNASTIAVGSSTALGSGQLALNSGTLQAAADGLTLANATVLSTYGVIDTQGFALTYAGAISGAGQLIKVGSGTLTPTGDNSYTGDTIVGAGTLRVGSATAISPTSAVTVAAGGTLDIGGFNVPIASLSGAGTVLNGSATAASLNVNGNGSSTVFAGTIVDGSAPLTLVKTGAGMLTLSGANTFSGGSVLTAGAIGVGNDAALGTGPLTMANGTALVFTGSYSIANAIVFGLPGDTGVPGDPTFDTGPNAVVVSGVISGADDLTKLGTGSLDLTAIDTYTGATDVVQGSLVVDGSIAASTVTVENGASVGGSGAIGGLVVRSGGVVAPGSLTPFSTLTVRGNVTFQESSVLLVDIDPTGRTDAVQAAGTAAISGAAVDVVAAPGTYNPSLKYTILTAAGGLSGQFTAATLTSNLAFLAPTLSYTGTSAILGFKQVAPLTSSAATPNQRAVAGAIQGLGAGNPVFNAVVGQSAAGAQQAFQALSGESHASTVRSAFAGASLVSTAVFDRLWNVNVGTGSDALQVLDQFGPTTLPTLLRCYAPTTGPNGEPVSTYSVWGQAFGDFGRSGGDGNASAVDRTLGGFAVGIDSRTDARGLENWRIGVASGYTNDNFSVKNTGSSGTFENVFGTLYAGARYGAVDVKLAGGYGGTTTDLNRTVAFPGFSESEHSNYGGFIAQGFGELGYRLAFGQSVLEPIVGGAVTSVHQDRFHENGGSAALIGFAQDTTVETTALGFRAEAIPLQTLPLVARLYLAWQHAFGDINPATTLAFAAAPSTPFTTFGAPADRDAAVAEAALEYRATSALSFGLSYAGSIGARDSDNAVKGRVDYRF